MNRRLTIVLIVLLPGGGAVAKYTPRSKSPPKPPPDLCKDTIDPYRPSIQKSRFFQAAGADNELTEAEFNANKAKPNSFVRRFDSWRALSAFDKDSNKSIDWLEADAYRYAIRKRVLAAYDTNADGKLSGGERTKANTDLARGRVPAPPKSTHKSPKAHSGSGTDNEAERSRLKAQLDAIRKKLYHSPAVAKLRGACEAAERTYEKAKEAPGIVEARKPYDAARQAYEKARENTPEARMYEKLKKAYYDAYHNMPEYKAYRAARDALNHGGNRAAYERAKSIYEARRVKIPEYADYKTAREAREKAAAATGEYKDLQDAEKAYRQVYENLLTRERKVRDDARQARDAKVEQLLKVDPTARTICKRLKKIEAKH
ncbi:MAG: hypothetical protein ISS69_11110 [Phycisphaerae bacterium]|nr:hypothetical protein [Phycisphaerae bacterium]